MTTFYLIGGAPRCGKTTIAKQLSDSTGIPWISADTFESIVSVYIDESKHAEVFPKGVMRKKTNLSNDDMYARYSTEEITTAYIQQYMAVWDAIDMLVQVESKNKHAYIIEGHQIHPKLIKRLETIETAVIKAVFVGRSNVEQLILDATSHPNEDDWFVKKTKEEKTYTAIAHMIVSYSQFFETEASSLGYQYISMDDFLTGVTKALDVL